MKFNEFLEESEIDDIQEAPAGAFTQMARKAGSKIASKVGLKGVAGNLATKANVGDEANRVKQELAQWMAGSGIKKGQLELNDLIAFLGNAGFDKKAVATVARKYVPKTSPNTAPDTLTASLESSITEAVDNALVDKIIADLVQMGFKKQAGGKQARSKYALTPEPKSAGAAPTAGTTDPKLAAAIKQLQQAGYKVSK
jgi:hypothetical protein